MKIVVTGGTGTVGSLVIKHYLKKYADIEVWCFSRDEFKQFHMQEEIDDNRLFFAIGDVRDAESVDAACDGVDLIVHTAALKHVATGENYPHEVVKTNVHGTKNVVDAANRNGAKMVLVSTDKAIQPVNLYGATKMIAEHLTLIGGQRVVRFGNIFGSRGSVLHIFNEWCERGKTFKITDKRMTRFIAKQEDVGDYIESALSGHAGSVYIPELKAMRIVDLALAFDEDAVIKEIGMFKGEKLAESLEIGKSSADAELYTIDEIKALIKETL